MRRHARGRHHHSLRSDRFMWVHLTSALYFSLARRPKWWHHLEGISALLPPNNEANPPSTIIYLFLSTIFWWFISQHTPFSHVSSLHFKKMSIFFIRYPPIVLGELVQPTRIPYLTEEGWLTTCNVPLFINALSSTMAADSVGYSGDYLYVLIRIHMNERL